MTKFISNLACVCFVPHYRCQAHSVQRHSRQQPASADDAHTQSIYISINLVCRAAFGSRRMKKEHTLNDKYLKYRSSCWKCCCLCFLCYTIGMASTRPFPAAAKQKCMEREQHVRRDFYLKFVVIRMRWDAKHIICACIAAAAAAQAIIGTVYRMHRVEWASEWVNEWMSERKKPGL